jgi:RHS repeat-associated protein
LERFIYDPYGTRTVLNASTWATTSDSQSWLFGYQGGRLDLTSGKVNFRHRDLDTVTDTWMEKDPLGYAAGANPYQDDDSNPTGMVDAMGTTAAAAAPPLVGPSGGEVIWRTTVIEGTAEIPFLGQILGAACTGAWLLDQKTQADAIEGQRLAAIPTNPKAGPRRTLADIQAEADARESSTATGGNFGAVAGADDSSTPLGGSFADNSAAAAQAKSQAGVAAGAPAMPPTTQPSGGPGARPVVQTSLPDRVTKELPVGEGRTTEECGQSRNFFERNRQAARDWWESRTGKKWPSDSTHDEHPRPLKDGGDPLYVEPGSGGPSTPHQSNGDFQRWGKMGGRPPKE